MSEPVLISPSSDLTIFEVTEFMQTLHAALAVNPSVKLDLTHAGKIDASGLQVIMAAHRSGKLTLHGLSPLTIEDFRQVGWNPAGKGTL